MSGFLSRPGCPGRPLDWNSFTEFLDSSRFPQAEHRMRMREFLRSKYAATRIDLVISTSPFALDFIAGAPPVPFSDRACDLRARFEPRVAPAAPPLRSDRHPGSIRPGEDPGHGAAPTATGEPRGHRDRGGRVRQDVGGHRPRGLPRTCPTYISTSSPVSRCLNFSRRWPICPEIRSSCSFP